MLDFITTQFLVADRGGMRSMDDLVTYSYLRQNFVDFRRVRKQLQKATINLITSVCSSLRFSFRTDKFSLNLLVGVFTKICQYIPILVKVEHKQRTRYTISGVFIIISRSGWSS
jgi:hypothetical protein